VHRQVRDIWDARRGRHGHLSGLMLAATRSQQQASELVESSVSGTNGASLTLRVSPVFELPSVPIACLRRNLDRFDAVRVEVGDSDVSFEQRNERLDRPTHSKV